MNFFSFLRKNHPNFFLTMLGNIAVYLSVGLGFAVGPAQWHTSTNYQIVDRFIPMEIWGWAMVLIAILLTYGLYVGKWRLVQYAMYLGSGIATVFTLGFLAIALTGSLAGIAGPALWGYFLISQLAQGDEPPTNPSNSKELIDRKELKKYFGN